MPRSLTPAEVALYNRLIDVLVPDEAAILRAQIAVAKIREDPDDEHAYFTFDRPVPLLRLNSSQAISGSYVDSDGWPIDIIVHAANGLLCFMERYRTDGKPIQSSGTAKPAEVRLTPSKDQL